MRVGRQEPTKNKTYNQYQTTYLSHKDHKLSYRTVSGDSENKGLGPISFFALGCEEQLHLVTQSSLYQPRLRPHNQRNY